MVPHAAAAEIREFKTDHFVVQYPSGADEFSREAARQAEEYYRSIAEDLGYVRYDNFWRWDNRVRIIIYADHDAYLRATGRPAWSHGVADYTRKTIASYVWGTGFLDTLLAHEIAHLIFRDFVGFKGEVPLWLDEGVAQWTQKRRSGEYDGAMAQVKNAPVRLGLVEMMRLDIRALSADELVSFGAGSQRATLSGAQMIRLYYAQALSVVEFLMQRYGTDRFVQLCRQLRDGRTLDEALPFVFPAQMRTLDEMETQWTAYVNSFLPEGTQRVEETR